MSLSDYLFPGKEHEENLDTKFAYIESKCDAFLDNTIKMFESMPIDDYHINCPRNLLKKMSSYKRAKYQDAVEKIQDSIMKNVRQYMRFRELASDQTAKDHSIYSLSATGRFDFVESLLLYLP